MYTLCTICTFIIFFPSTWLKITVTAFIDWKLFLRNVNLEEKFFLSGEKFEIGNHESDPRRVYFLQTQK